VLKAQQERDADGKLSRSQAETANGVHVTVDAGGEGCVVAYGEGAGGVGEEGDDRVGAVAKGGECAGGWGW